eukprot:TRINITY_DN12298_c0_g1_i1.p1 TRINITY_DN12298_c0_g1~~TRINITY_DN12298_c0_g1_i1.p1  ORF type:complete len:232 (-),score=35.48 TRINITY_DN12298_c0_g1_i1:184-879(-)
MNPAIEFFREKERWGELSNFYALKKPIIYNGKTYATSEHLYQALKYIRENSTKADLDFAEVIRLVNTPYKSKILANQEISNRYKWRTALNEDIIRFQQLGAEPTEFTDEQILDLMRKVLRLKFNADPHCRKILLSTGNSTLVEANPSDDFWACGRGNGLNHLGKLLEEIRSELRSSEISSIPASELPMELNSDQLQQIEQNRLMALERRKRTAEQRQQSAKKIKRDQEALL